MVNEALLNIINLMLDKKNKPILEKLDNKMNLRNDIGFDSLDLAELTVRIESEFGVDIFEDSIVSTIGEVLKKIESQNDK